MKLEAKLKAAVEKAERATKRAQSLKEYSRQIDRERHHVAMCKLLGPAFEKAKRAMPTIDEISAMVKTLSNERSDKHTKHISTQEFLDRKHNGNNRAR